MLSKHDNINNYDHFTIRGLRDKRAQTWVMGIFNLLEFSNKFLITLKIACNIAH